MEQSEKELYGTESQGTVWNRERRNCMEKREKELYGTEREGIVWDNERRNCVELWRRECSLCFFIKHSLCSERENVCERASERERESVCVCVRERDRGREREREREKKGDPSAGHIFPRPGGGRESVSHPTPCACVCMRE